MSLDQITAGYCNLVTGEEHYINGDEYKTAASMYKLPLNMYFTDLIQSSQLDWDSYYPNVTYEYVRDSSTTRITTGRCFSGAAALLRTPSSVSLPRPIWALT